MGRWQRGYSLEVISEEDVQPTESIEWTDEEEEEEEWNHYREFGRLSRLRQLQIQALCSDCHLSPTEMDNQQQQQQQQPVRRRNSTYLALACANAVSQGAMTRSLRQMFETQPIRETQPLLSRAEIQQAIQAAKLRRNSIAVCSPSEPEIVTATPAVVVPVIDQPQRPPVPAKSTSVPTSPVKIATSPLRQLSSPTTPTPSTPPTSPFGQVGGVRCDKCSSILSPSSPVSVVINSPVTEVDEEVEEEDTPTGSKSPSKIVPTNREVVEEELPKPDTVKNARCLFESTLMEMTNGYGTLQHVKSNTSAKIVRSESTMTLDRASVRSFQSNRPTFRWPSRHDNIRRSPSPSSPAPSPLPTLTVPSQQPSKHKMASTLPSYYRSSPSLTQYRSSRHSLHSTDVESYVSEGGSDCWSSSDLESEASYSASSRDESGNGDGLDGMRYISPDVMEKIRSYGMTLTFVNGKMVDEDDEQDEPEVAAKQVATRKVVQSIRSAGQSQPMTTATTTTTSKSAPPPVAPKKSKHHPPAQPRIVACLPKPSERPTTNKSSNKIKKIRHSSGESSASSGVSSGPSAESSSSEHNSPFATLKRTKSADADHTVERSPSPGPRQSGTVKEVGSSPFGCYSVVYSFNASARSPMYV